MRWIARGWLAAHPAVSTGLILVRWLAWLLAGHPIATSILALTLAFGLPAPWLLFALCADGVVGATVGELGPARFGSLWHWQRACRFHRRWPSIATEIGVAVDAYLPAVLPGESIVAPHGYRPVLAAPRLSLVPVYADGSEVAWTVRPAAARSFEGLGELVAQIPAVDRRISSAGLEHASDGSGRWLLVVIFAGAKLAIRDVNADLIDQPDRSNTVPGVDQVLTDNDVINDDLAAPAPEETTAMESEDRLGLSRHRRQNAAPPSNPAPWRPRSNRLRRDEWNRRRDGHDEV